MNLDKTAKALKKINRLYDIINDIGEASATEIDLLKAYAKDLYESLKDDDEVEAEKSAKELAKQRKKEEKKLKKEQEKKAAEQQEAMERDAAKRKAAKEEAEKAAARKEVEQPVTPVSKPQTAASSATDTKMAAPAAPSGFSAEMVELFEKDTVAELSDKLSSSPIKDLTKAMGINERIFTVNELFGGNQDEFNNLMIALNGLDSYDSAKAVIMKSAASKYDWDSPGKQKKARTLVKLIQRRFK